MDVEVLHVSGAYAIAKGLQHTACLLVSFAWNREAYRRVRKAVHVQGYLSAVLPSVLGARSWPVGSGTVGSACGRFGLRVKRTCTRWTRRAADSAHAIMAAIFSEDDR